MDWKFLTTVSGLWLTALIATAIYAKLNGTATTVLIFCVIVGTILFGVCSIMALINSLKEAM